MPAGDLVEVEPEAFLGDAALEVDREEAVVAPGQRPERDVRPALELARLPERRAAGPSPLRHPGPDPARHVVQEVPLLVVVRALPGRCISRLPRLHGAGVVPPI